MNPEKEWLHLLTYVTFQWKDFPKDTPLSENSCGLLLPPFAEIVSGGFFFFDGFGMTEPTEQFSRGKRQKLQLNQLSAVMDSGGQHPKQQYFCSQIDREFNDVLERPIYAHDLDPAIRGTFGVFKIKLKEGESQFIEKNSVVRIPL